MDYTPFVRKHRESGADITVAALPMDAKRAEAFGVMKIDDTGRIVDFAEKPKGDALRAMEVDTTVLGLEAHRWPPSPFSLPTCPHPPPRSPGADPEVGLERSVTSEGELCVPAAE